MEKRYVLKDKNDFFWFLHADKKDFSPSFNTVAGADKYTSEDLKFIYSNFGDKFFINNIKVYEVILSLGSEVSPHQIALM